MRKVIRKSVFETNSSSMHSICVTKEDKISNQDYSEKLNSSKPFDLHLDYSDIEFDRYPFRILSTFVEKFCYAVAENCGYKPLDEAEENFKSLLSIAKKYYPNLNSVILPQMETGIYSNGKMSFCQEELSYKDGGYVQERLGIKNIKRNYKTHSFEGEKDGKRISFSKKGTKKINYFGVVDHQSAGLLSNFLAKNNISMEKFLAEKRYAVVIDGDEYCEFMDYVKSGIIDGDNLETIYPNDFREEEV